MKFRKLVITGIAVLGLASISGISANASGYMDGYLSEAAYDTPLRSIKRSIYLKRLSHSSSFAGTHQIGSKWLHKGDKVGIVPFYHMGHDGYVVYVPYSDHIYYTPANNSNWFMTKRHHQRKARHFHYPKHLTRRQRKELKDRDEVDRIQDKASKYMKSHFRRTNNKRLLRKSGYKLQDHYGAKTIESKYYPNSKKAYIPKSLNLKDILNWQNYSTVVLYNYKGHNNWEKFNL